MNVVISESKRKLKDQQENEKQDLILLINKDQLKENDYIFIGYLPSSYNEKMTHTLLRFVKNELDKKDRPIVFYFNYITNKSNKLYKLSKSELIDLITDSSFVKMSKDKKKILEFTKKSKKTLVPKYGKLAEDVFNPIHGSPIDSLNENVENDDFLMNKSEIVKPSDNIISDIEKKRMLTFFENKNKFHNKTNKKIKSPKIKVAVRAMVKYPATYNEANKKSISPQNEAVVKSDRAIDEYINPRSKTNKKYESPQNKTNTISKSPQNKMVVYQPETKKKRSSDNKIIIRAPRDMTKRAPRDITNKSNNKYHNKTNKVSPRTRIVNDIIGNIGNIFGYVNQKQSLSPNNVYETNVRARRKQLLDPKYNVGEEKERLYKAMHSEGDKELK